MTDVKSSLRRRIEDRSAAIAIIGMGYVGLPLGLAFAEAGFKVVGIDLDKTKVDALNAGKSYIRHLGADTIRGAVATGRFRATTEYSAARDTDAIIVCVPTPLTSTREPDVSFIRSAGDALAPHLRKGQLLALESTSYPGTTDELLKPLLERVGTIGVDVFLAFSPEREDPGNKRFNTKTIPKIVGGYTEACRDVAVALYASALKEIVPVSSTRVAELAKLLENIFRSVNIALVNELKMLCDRMGLDVWEVIEAASSKPFGFMPFYPGPGLGGHCIPIDPFYLTWKAREFEFQTKFIELAGEVNTYMPQYVIQRTMEALNTSRKSINGARLLVLGVAYKKDIDDVRESPALRIISLLKERGAEVAYHDPYIPQLLDLHGFKYRMESVGYDAARLGEYDAVVILTDHSGIDYAQVVENARCVVDTRNATRAVKQHRERVFKA